ncbi:MAG: DUF547 domain-containing protein [Candidatus Thorarchaeota archaeon]|nr:DUF547 domain-containing protein [Candidatus Thorarchaeota archaeon]
MSENDTMSVTLEGVLKRYRDPFGNVDYFSMMADNSIVQFAESLAEFDLSSLDSREKGLAFWINCYNALSIYGVLRKLKAEPSFAEKGNTSWFQRVRFFALQKFIVGGSQYTLRDIENRVREEYKDPRIHFALNCSSMGCPALKDGRYSAENINEELDAATKLYLSSPQGLSINTDGGELYLSMIFKWYKKDFEATGKSVKEYVLPYVSDEQREFIEKNMDTIKVKYIDYDWSLNASEGAE